MKLKTLVRAITPFKDRERSSSDVESIDSSTFIWDLKDVNLVKVLESFYNDFYPEKIDLVQEIIGKYKGEELLLLQQLCDRYQLTEKEMQRYVNVGKKRQVSFININNTEDNKLAPRSSSRGGLHHKPSPPPLESPHNLPPQTPYLTSPSLNKQNKSSSMNNIHKAPPLPDQPPQQHQFQQRNQSLPNLSNQQYKQEYQNNSSSRPQDIDYYSNNHSHNNKHNQINQSLQNQPNQHQQSRSSEIYNSFIIDSQNNPPPLSPSPKLNIKKSVDKSYQNNDIVKNNDRNISDNLNDYQYSNNKHNNNVYNENYNHSNDINNYYQNPNNYNNINDINQNKKAYNNFQTQNNKPITNYGFDGPPPLPPPNEVTDNNYENNPSSSNNYAGNNITNISTKPSMKFYQNFSWDIEKYRPGIGFGLTLLYEENNPTKSPNLSILEKKTDKEILHLLKQLCRRHHLTEKKMEEYLVRGLDTYDQELNKKDIEIYNGNYESNQYNDNLGSPNSYLPLPTNNGGYEEEFVPLVPIATNNNYNNTDTITNNNNNTNSNINININSNSNTDTYTNSVPYSPPPLSQIVSSFKENEMNIGKVNEEFKNSIRSQLGINTPILSPTYNATKNFGTTDNQNSLKKNDPKSELTNELKSKIESSINKEEKTKKSEEKKNNIEDLVESAKELHQEISDKEEIENLRLEMSLLKIKNDQLTSDNHNLILLLNDEKNVYKEKLEAEKSNLINETEKKLWSLNSGRKCNKEVQVDDKHLYESYNRIKEKLKLEEDRTKNIELESIKHLKENKELMVKNLQLQNLIKNLYEDKKILLYLINLLNNVPNTIDNNKIIYGYINNVLLENISDAVKRKLFNTISLDQNAYEENDLLDGNINNNIMISEKLDRVLKWKHSKDDEFFKKSLESNDEILNTIDNSSHSLDFYKIFNLVGKDSNLDNSETKSSPTNLDNIILSNKEDQTEDLIKKIEKFEEKFLYSEISNNNNINNMKNKILEDFCSTNEINMLKNINKSVNKKGKTKLNKSSTYSRSPSTSPSPSTSSLNNSQILSSTISEALSSTDLMTEQYNLAKEFLHTQKTKSLIEMKMSETNKKIFEMQKKELLNQSKLNSSMSVSSSPSPSPLKSSNINEESVTDWVLCFDPKSGKRYYHSHTLKKSTWKKPANFLLKETTKKLTVKNVSKPEEFFANNSCKYIFLYIHLTFFN